MTTKEKIVLIFVDFILIIFSIYLAVVIRFEGAFSERYLSGFEWLFVINAIFCIVCYYAYGLYEKLWRYAGIQELKNIFIANSIAFAPSAVAAFVTGGRYYSRSIIIISALLAFFFTGGIRFLLRIINERVGKHCLIGKNVLIVGVNDAGEAIARELLRGILGGYIPVGFIDEDGKRLKVRIHDIPVLGSLKDLSRVVKEKCIEEIIIALPSPSLIREVIKECENIKVKFKVVPSISEIINGRLSVSSIRNVEIKDLLERETVNLDMKPVKGFLKDKTVLVTGAGGSIGSELCRQVVQHDIKKLILLGRGENSIYEIHIELKNKTAVPLVLFIGDIRDKRRMESLMKDHRPDIIFHAAAHKHVPLMEDNPAEAVANNVLGTRNIIELAEKYGVESMTILSTDKAVNPTSVMGATKRLSEMFMKSFSAGKKCRYSAVRFGNVLDSRGSVVPTFRRQIAMGGPVTVTHAEMTRFFMTIPEAVQLVIQAAAMGKNGEIFILDMGRPVKILDLAKNMIRLCGYEPGKDIQIEIKGIRPGEKLEEELVNSGETTEKTEIDKIDRVATDTVTPEKMSEYFEKLTGLVEEGNDEGVRQTLIEVVPNFKPIYEKVSI